MAPHRHDRQLTGVQPDSIRIDKRIEHGWSLQNFMPTKRRTSHGKVAPAGSPLLVRVEMNMSVGLRSVSRSAYDSIVSGSYFSGAFEQRSSQLLDGRHGSVPALELDERRLRAGALREARGALDRTVVAEGWRALRIRHMGTEQQREAGGKDSK